LGFDLNVHHPYKPLVEAIKKFKVAQNALAQVAWNFVNDGYDPMLFFLLSFNNSSSMFSLPTLAFVHTLENRSACNLSLIILRQVPFSLLPSSSK